MKKSLWLILLVFLAVVSLNAQNDTVIFSVRGGFYEDVFALHLYNINPWNHIRYTTNGNRPTAESPLYMDSLWLDETKYSESDIYTIQISPENLVYVPDSVQHCIIIRAAVFDENDSCVSQVMTNSYFISALGCDTHGLPAVSICADSLDLFDYKLGIMVPGIMFDSLNPHQTGNYYMHGKDWERRINVEFREVGDNGGINQTCGLRTHGNRVRRQPQKGLKIYAREEYGKKRFNYRFFEESPMNSFKHLLIKPFSSLYPFSGIQDYICSQMAIGIGLEAGNTRPVCLYINGEYWGIYFLQEKMDERYLEDHLGINIEQCNIISNWMELECGNPQGFYDMMDWLETADLTVQEEYDYLSSMVDIDNFIDYMIFETFVANLDWPANNNRCWQTVGGKWRWMFFDGDAAFNAYGVDPFGNPTNLDVFGNATYTGEYTWPSSKRATLLFRKLVDNQYFKYKFDAGIMTLCQTLFTYENTSQYYHHICDLLYSEIDAQSFRFGNPSSSDYWNQACTLTNDFLENRVDSYLAEWFNYTTDIPDYQTAFHCYPNPFTDKIHIKVDSNGFGKEEAVIYDLLGRKVFSELIVAESNEEITINPELPAGVYVLKVGGLICRIVSY